MHESGFPQPPVTRSSPRQSHSPPSIPPTNATPLGGVRCRPLEWRSLSNRLSHLDSGAVSSFVRFALAVVSLVFIVQTVGGWRARLRVRPTASTPDHPNTSRCSSRHGSSPAGSSRQPYRPDSPGCVSCVNHARAAAPQLALEIQLRRRRPVHHRAVRYAQRRRGSRHHSRSAERLAPHRRQTARRGAGRNGAHAASPACDPPGLTPTSGRPTPSVTRM